MEGYSLNMLQAKFNDLVDAIYEGKRPVTSADYEALMELDRIIERRIGTVMAIARANTND